MSPESYQKLVNIAETFSSPLYKDIQAIGPIWFPKRKDQGIATFLARAVVGQQFATKTAQSIWVRVEASGLNVGQPVPQLFHARNTEKLKACGLSRNKIKALIGIREAEETGYLDGTSIKAMDNETRSKHLCNIWGIGQWTCDMASIFYCNDTDVWPEGDFTVRTTFKRYAGRRSLAKASALFAPHRSILALYMWRIVDGKS